MLPRSDYLNKKLKKLEFLAYTDMLTKAKNRNFLYDKLRHAHYKYLYFLDINDLKTVNDKFGHIKGDEYIISIVDKIKSICSSDSILIRYGGDEFLVFSNTKKSFSNVNCSVGFVELGKMLLDKSISTASFNMYKEKYLK